MAIEKCEVISSYLCDLPYTALNEQGMTQLEAPDLPSIKCILAFKTNKYNRLQDICGFERIQCNNTRTALMCKQLGNVFQMLIRTSIIYSFTILNIIIINIQCNNNNGHK